MVFFYTIYIEILCVYAIYFYHFNSYRVPPPNLEQIYLNNYSPNLGQICFELRFLWMMLSYNLSQGSRRITLYRLRVQSINNSFSSNWVQGIIHSSTWSAFWLNGYHNQTWPSSSSISCIQSILQRFMQKSILNDSHFSQNLRITLSPGYG